MAHQVHLDSDLFGSVYYWNVIKLWGEKTRILQLKNETFSDGKRKNPRRRDRTHTNIVVALVWILGLP
jgi:hypothetical protein